MPFPGSQGRSGAAGQPTRRETRMSDQSLHDAEPPRRLRRGPAPRLYVIARQTPVPWLRVRRLDKADRAKLVAHFVRMAAADRRPKSRAGLDVATIAAL